MNGTQKKAVSRKPKTKPATTAPRARTCRLNPLMRTSLATAKGRVRSTTCNAKDSGKPPSI